MCSNYKRQDTVSNPDFVPGDPVSLSNPESIDNPEDELQFANRMVRNFLSENVKGHEVRAAKAEATALLNTSVSISDPAPGPV
jgi:hypothetical protein